MAPTTTLQASTEAFLKDSGIEYANSNSVGYLKLREAFFIEDETFPSGIALPMTAAETQRLVRHCIRANVPFTVRGGGHDPFTRYAAQDAVTIDLRPVSYVHVGADKTTATIGGGTTHGTLVAELQTHGLHAATGSVATVGYVGWAAIGGYGPSSAWAGLGVDQIVAARIVDAEGELVDAAEKALRGIRGGGGNFGVVTDITIKVYPLEEVRHPYMHV